MHKILERSNGFSDIEFKNKDERKTLSFDVTLPGNKNSINKVSYKAKVEGDILSRGIDKIIYSHISHQTRFPKSDVSLIKFNLNIKAKNIAYLMGSGDKVPESLSLVGYNVDLFEKKDINAEKLKKIYDTYSLSRSFISMRLHGLWLISNW